MLPVAASVLRLRWASPQEIQVWSDACCTSPSSASLPGSPCGGDTELPGCRRSPVPHELCLSSQKSRGGPSPLHTRGCSGGHWLHPGLTGRGCAWGLGQLAAGSKQGTGGCGALNVWWTAPNKPFPEAHFSAHHKALPRQRLLVPYSLRSAAQLNCSR